MANIKSQIKRNRQNEAARMRNKSARTALKSAAKQVRAAVETGDVQTAQEALRAISRDLDRAASKGVLHKRAAARRKSRLARATAGASATAGQ